METFSALPDLFVRGIHRSPVTHTVNPPPPPPPPPPPQCNMLYWRSKCNFHTACWGAVGCEWRTTYVYFGVTYVYFILRIFPGFFAVWSQCQHRFLLFMSKNHWKDTSNFFVKNPCRFKTWIGFIGQILIKLEMSLIRGFLQLPLSYPLGSNLCKHAGGHSVTTESCTSLAIVYRGYPAKRALPAMLTHGR